jgi:hypothetical protein
MDASASLYVATAVIVARSVCVFLPGAFKKPINFRKSRERLKVSHSQTIKQFQPAFRSARTASASRSTFLANLAFQYFARVFGVVVRGQPLCLCQKHPCTKITFLSLGNTKSGLPGKVR